MTKIAADLEDFAPWEAGSHDQASIGDDALSVNQGLRAVPARSTAYRRLDQSARHAPAAIGSARARRFTSSEIGFRRAVVDEWREHAVGGSSAG